VATGCLLAVLIGVALVGWWAAVFTILVALGAAAIGLMARSRIQGYTGDVLGAAQQVGEVISLVLAAALVSSGVYESLWWR
jgi:adenosylcobinamide-GDP ribazoletransferase